MELFWLLNGRGDFDSDGTLNNLHVGRWGDPDHLLNALRNLSGGQAALPLFPRPGIYQADDDGNVADGAFGFGLRAYGHPLDFDGSGRFVQEGDPRLAQFLNNRDASNTQTGPIKWLQYTGYSLYDQNADAWYQVSPATYNPAANLMANSYLFGREVNGTGLNHSNALMQYDTTLGVTTARLNPNYEHPSETIVEPERVSRPADDIFTAQDLPELFMAAGDLTSAIDAASISRRLSTLMPYTLGDPLIAKRFTTMSWRYRLLALANALGPDGQLGTNDDGPRAWEHTADSVLSDTNGDGRVDTGDRANGKLEFPPQFATIIPFSNGAATLDGDGNLNEDPFRPQVRRMLRIEVGDTKAEFGQRPLSINQLTDVERLPNRAADLITGVLETRPLTEHPLAGTDTQTMTGTNLTTWTTNNLPAFPPTTAESREFWARRDRQKMARDIYVLLYTLCGGQDTVATTGSNLNINVSTPSYTTTIYTPEQLDQMAQFAVNMVDALDRDNVITRFEYDRNLGASVITDTGGLTESYAGWNLDDNPDTSNDVKVPASMAGSVAAGFDINDYERGVVYGVETQEATFSETLGIRSNPVDANHDSTPWDDEDITRLHLFIELQNMLPHDLPLYAEDGSAFGSRNASNATWRIRRIERSAGIADTTLEFLPNIANTITPGGLFSIGTNFSGSQATGDESLEYSDYYVDADYDQVSFECIAPQSNTNLPLVANVPPTPSTDTAYNPRTNLDLSHDAHRLNAERFAVDRVQTPNRGAFFLKSFDTDDPTTLDAALNSFELVLERRANPNLPSMLAGNNQILNDGNPVPEGLNDWVVVDRMNVNWRPFNLQQSDMATEIQTHLLGDSTLANEPGLQSRYRSELLDRGSEALTQTGMPPTTGFAYHLNTMRSPSAPGTAGWHPDRIGQCGCPAFVSGSFRP